MFTVPIISKEALNQFVGVSWVLSIDSSCMAQGKLMASSGGNRPGSLRNSISVDQKPFSRQAASDMGIWLCERMLHRSLPPSLERSFILMRKQNIAVGKTYVNERAQIAREVVEEVDRRKIKYNAFDLKDSKATPSVMQICRKSALALLADREANPDEIAKLHQF
jgi:hypothetical protein